MEFILPHIEYKIEGALDVAVVASLFITQIMNISSRRKDIKESIEIKKRNYSKEFVQQFFNEMVVNYVTELNKSCYEFVFKHMMMASIIFHKDVDAERKERPEYEKLQYNVIAKVDYLERSIENFNVFIKTAVEDRNGLNSNEFEEIQINLERTSSKIAELRKFMFSKSIVADDINHKIKEMMESVANLSLSIGRLYSSNAEVKHEKFEAA